LKVLDLAMVHEGLQGLIHLSDAAEWARTAHIEFALSELTRGEHRHLLYALAQRVDIDPVSASQDVSIQLHTHTDTDFPLGEDAALQGELNDNRSVLESYGFTDLVRFCYPSGVYDRRFLPVLRAAIVETATTVDPGVNFPDTAPLLLTRFLDSTSIGQVEFAAEMFGLGEILRGFRTGWIHGSLRAHVAARGHA
jgi:hypothetical protein